jgi:hypothetical protein
MSVLNQVLSGLANYLSLSQEERLGSVEEKVAGDILRV